MVWLPRGFPWQQPCPCLLQWPALAQLFLATWSPGGGYRLGFDRRAQWLPTLPLCLLWEPRDHMGWGQLGYTSRSTEVVMGADISCVRAPGDRV